MSSTFNREEGAVEHTQLSGIVGIAWLSLSKRAVNL